jgi:hypothetical protein
MYHTCAVRITKGESMETMAERMNREQLYQQILETAAQKMPAQAQPKPQFASPHSFYFPWEQSQVPANGSTSAESNGQ